MDKSVVARFMAHSTRARLEWALQRQRGEWGWIVWYRAHAGRWVYRLVLWKRALWDGRMLAHVLHLPVKSSRS